MEYALSLIISLLFPFVKFPPWNLLFLVPYSIVWDFSMGPLRGFDIGVSLCRLLDQQIAILSNLVVLGHCLVKEVSFLHVLEHAQFLE